MITSMAPLSRRAFVASLVAGLAGACSRGDEDAVPTTTGPPPTTGTTASPTTTATTLPPVELPGPPFTLGVASGDPTTDGVVLWTRLAPDPLAGGGMPDAAVEVTWEVATDPRFADVRRWGTAVASPDRGHSLHVEVDGLESGTAYSYRFTVGEHISTVGSTRTISSSPDSLAFAFASCQQYERGYYTAHRNLAEEDLDLVVFLGDYLYEGGPTEGDIRRHEGPEPTDLVGYRNRYAQYKGDPDLQASHAAHPWLVVWDDHEVENNYAGDQQSGGGDAAAFLERRAAAYRAWWEHQPVRLPIPDGADLRMHRTVDVGGLARFALLDTRQYRSDQACGVQGDVGVACAEVDDPARTMLGAEQEAWLFDQLATSTATWDILAQQVILAPTPVPLGDTDVVNLDQWDGYPPARRRLLEALAGREGRNTMVITGDIHASGVGDLLLDPDDPASPIVGTELVGTSISSAFTEQFVDLVESTARELPYIHYYDARHRGYVRCTVTPESFRADYRFVDTITEPTSGISTAASFVVDAGTPGARPA